MEKPLPRLEDESWGKGKRVQENLNEGRVVEYGSLELQSGWAR